MARTTDGRLAYADLLRTAATFAVLLLHISGGWMGSTPVDGSDWAVLNLYDGLARWCVPVFVMLSGAFLLDPGKKETARSLFFRCLRILTALVFWGGLYAVADHISSGGTLSLRTVMDAALLALRGNTHYHLWFLYMILGLYLVTPVLRVFVRGASRSDLHWFLFLCFLFAVLLPTLLRLWPSSTVSRWQNQLDLHLPLGYVGYFVAGYYLRHYTIGRIAEFLLYGLGIAGGVVTVWGTSVLSRQAGSFQDLFYGYFAPNVAAMSVAVFVLFRYLLGVSEERDRRQRLSGTARLSFGIYLVHDFFIMLLRHFGVSTLSFPPILSVPLLTAAVFLAAFFTAWLISKIPFVGSYLT